MFKDKCDVGAEKGRVLPRLAGKHAFAAPLLRGKQTVRPRYKAKRVVFVHYILHNIHRVSSLMTTTGTVAVFGILTNPALSHRQVVPSAQTVQEAVDSLHQQKQVSSIVLNSLDSSCCLVDIPPQYRTW